MVKRVLVSAGPIPAKLDSVKVLTNKFKGGLALWTAKLLAESRDFDVHVVASRMTEVTGFSTSRTHYVSDIEEYMSFVKGFKADAYVLAAAVATFVDPAVVARFLGDSVVFSRNTVQKDYPRRCNAVFSGNFHG